MSEVALRPGWLRPVAIAVVLAAHAGAFLLRASEEVAPGSGPIEIAVVSEPEPSPEPTPELLPVDAARAETAPPPEDPAPEPRIEPEAELPPEPTPEPPPEPAPLAEALPPPPVDPPKKHPPEPPRRERRAEPPRPAPSIEASARAAARAAAGEARRAAAASYAALVAGEIRSHRHYPPAARAANITGVVVVAFTVGPGGPIASHSIVRPSGPGVLDGAVRAMMSAVRLPPPPGGLFTSSIPVRFETR